MQSGKLSGFAMRIVTALCKGVSMVNMVSEQREFYQRKKVATEIKHFILEKYIASWGGIILQGNKGRQVRLAFVDTCAGSGLLAASISELRPHLDHHLSESKHYMIWRPTNGILVVTFKAKAFSSKRMPKLLNRCKLLLRNTRQIKGIFH